MTAMSQGQLDMVRAFFCNEFETASPARRSGGAPTVDAVSEWVDALATSGLFASSELDNISEVWAAEPAAMLSLLIGDVDEIAVKRHGAAAHVPAVATPALVAVFERAS